VFPTNSRILGVVSQREAVGQNKTNSGGNVTTPSGLIIDRTTSQGLGNSAKAATVGTGAGIDAQRNKKP
jgi:hypothetical protein